MNDPMESRVKDLEWQVSDVRAAYTKVMVEMELGKMTIASMTEQLAASRQSNSDQRNSIKELKDELEDCRGINRALMRQIKTLKKKASQTKKPAAPTQRVQSFVTKCESVLL